MASSGAAFSLAEKLRMHETLNSNRLDLNIINAYEYLQCIF